MGIKQADVLVITAHADDAEFGAAGTVAQWVREGKEVVYVVCTNGDKGTTDRSVKPEDLARVREEEQKAAARVLGVREVVFLDHPDQSLEDTPEFRKEIVSVIRQFRPRIVVTSDPYRRYIWHRDHRIAGQVTLDAVFPLARDHLAYPDFIQEGLEPHKVEEILFWAAEDINFRSNITETFDLKVMALHCHKSQVKEIGNPHLEEWLRERCRTMADGEDFELAEAFHRVLIPL
ncbi:MAG: PIG-L family deacetylase [Syntrophobacteraceae bacterium]|nr:PIG-L family deacetylase [Syntrophobacteraceae bacterium]